MKKHPLYRSWRRLILPFVSGLLFSGFSQAQEISFFGETDSTPPGFIADREIGDDPFTVEATGEGGTVTIEILSQDPSTGSWDDTSGLSESVTGSTVRVELSATDTAPATFLRVRIVE